MKQTTSRLLTCTYAYTGRMDMHRELMERSMKFGGRIISLFERSVDTGLEGNRAI